VSIEAISAAFKAQGLTASEKLVLLVLADGANHETHQCWPSQKKLAEYTGLSKRTIWAAVDSLTKKGMIKKTGRLREGTHEKTSNLMELLIVTQAPGYVPRPVDKPRKTKTKVSQPLRHVSQPLPQGIATVATQNLPIEPLIEPSRAREPCEGALATRPDDAEMRARAKALREATSAALLATRKDPRDQSHRMRVRAQ
jgi:DNA-binding transcriptional MocR family regulator